MTYLCRISPQCTLSHIPVHNVRLCDYMAGCSNSDYTFHCNFDRKFHWRMLKIKILLEKM